MSLCKGNKRKNKIMGLQQIKKLFHSKENYKHKKIHPTEWEKIFANDISDKWLISKIVSEFMQLNIKISWLKMSRGTEQTCFWRRNTDSQLIHENMLNIIKTSVRYHFTFSRMSVIKKQQINVGESVEKRELLYIVGKNGNCYSQYRK